jgi:hypothetical protein
MRVINTKVIIEYILEVTAIFIVMELGISTEIGSSLPKLIGSPISTGINNTYLKISLIYLDFSWFYIYYYSCKYPILNSYALKIVSRFFIFVINSRKRNLITGNRGESF